MTTVDLAVVGAGPAGAAAAISAARAGLEVVVVDKARFPRDKTCGDGLTAQALRLLDEFGVGRADILGPGDGVAVHETVLVGPRGRMARLPLDARLAVVAPRRSIDAVLASRVAPAGARLLEGTTVRDVVVSQDGVKLGIEREGDEHDDGGDTIEARWVVAADGHWSPVRRALHPDRAPDLGMWHAIRQYHHEAGDGRLWVIFDETILPGYVWVFPLPDGRANVGYGVLRTDVARGRAEGASGRRRGHDLKALWPRLLDRPAVRAALGPRARPAEPVRAWPIPAGFSVDALTDPRVLYVGDAARVVDPLTGEGIAQALETGMLAAHAIIEGGDPTHVVERYRERVTTALGRDLRFASALQRVLRHPLAARATLRAVDANDWTRRNFARWMFEDYPRAAVLTPTRWHSLRSVA